MKLLFNLFCLLSYITSVSIEEVTIENQNEFKKIVLEQNEYEINLPVKTQKEQYMEVECIISHPSKFNISFNYTKKENSEEPENPEEPQNANVFYFDVNAKAAFIHPKRRLSTDLIIAENSNLGKNKVVLSLDEQMDNIAIYISKKEEEELTRSETIFVRYNIMDAYDEEAEEKYALDKEEISLAQKKDMLNISFSGIKYRSDFNCSNTTVNYEIKLFDKEKLESKYENIYVYSLLNSQSEALYATNLTLKGEVTQKINFIVIKAPLNDKKSQILLIDAKIKNLEDEELLQYKAYDNITVKEQSEEREWPDDDIKPDNNTNNDTNNNTDNKDKDGVNEKKNRENNKPKLVIILISFIASVILTFVAVFIYIKFFSKKDMNIEEDQDYKDVGGIVTNTEDKDKDKMETKKDAPKINEEEE